MVEVIKATSAITVRNSVSSTLTIKWNSVSRATLRVAAKSGISRTLAVIGKIGE